MKVTVLAVGRLKERWWRGAADEYLKRLRPYADVREVEVPDRDVTADEARAVREEGEALLRVLPAGAHVIALDPAGRGLSSEAFAERIEALKTGGVSHVAFVVGGAAGLAEDVRGRANEILSLGPMTLPHQLARVVLLEQVYRACRISRGEPYHR